MRHRPAVAALAAALLLALPTAAPAAETERDRGDEDCAALAKDEERSEDDGDRDGLDDSGECRSGTSPRDSDSDEDGVSDGDDDSDADALKNSDEAEGHSNPTDADSDGDGLGDAEDPVLSQPQIDENIFDEGPASSHVGDQRRR